MIEIETQELSLEGLPSTVLIPSTIIGQPMIFCGGPIKILREMTGRPNESVQVVIDALISYLSDQVGLKIEIPRVSEASEEKCAGMLLFSLLSCGVVQAAPRA